MAAKQRVLVVEDDLSLQALTCALLRPHYNPMPAGSIGEARAILDADPPDLVLLDLSLPDDDGFVLVRQLRTRAIDVPIIYVTAKASPGDKINGLDLGGDDYITKPYDPDELLSRIRAVLRRSRHYRTAAVPADDLRAGGIVVQTATRQTFDGAGNEIRLTRAEFDLLAALAAARGKVLSRAVLLDAIAAGPDHDATDRTVDALVSKIRRKLLEAGIRHSVIVTVHGIGYRAAPP